MIFVSLLLAVYVYSVEARVLPSIILLLLDDEQANNFEDRVARIERTNQTKCWNSDGDEINCAGSGQDGESRTGVGWPEPRFLDNGDGTITDELTGLVWLKDGDCVNGRRNFEMEDGLCGLSDGSQQDDWHIPNIRELLSLVDIGSQSGGLPMGHPFTLPDSAVSAVYYSSTYIAPVPPRSTTTRNASLNLARSNLSFPGSWIILNVLDGLILPVRHRNPATGNLHSFETNAPAAVEATDQTTCSFSIGWSKCSSSSRDGAGQWGVPFPTPRFVDNRDGTATDKLTGLIWMSNYNCAELAALDWQSALSAAGSFASGQCGVSDGSSAGDWRVPNALELTSLFDISREGLRYAFFGSELGILWSSTSLAADPSFALTLNSRFLFALPKSGGGISTLIVRDQ